jgi:hypothetical protein
VWRELIQLVLPCNGSHQGIVPESISILTCGPKSSAIGPWTFGCYKNLITKKVPICKNMVVSGARFPRVWFPLGHGSHRALFSGRYGFPHGMVLPMAGDPLRNGFPRAWCPLGQGSPWGKLTIGHDSYRALFSGIYGVPHGMVLPMAGFPWGMVSPWHHAPQGRVLPGASLP